IAAERTVADREGGAGELIEDAAAQPEVPTTTGAAVGTLSLVVAQDAVDHLNGRAKDITDGATRPLAAIDPGIGAAAEGDVPSEDAVHEEEGRTQRAIFDGPA